jgi:hypothetical protein
MKVGLRNYIFSERNLANIPKMSNQIQNGPALGELILKCNRLIALV